VALKKVFLIRHAKSSWDHPELTDMERPLNSRGQRDAPQMAAALANMDPGLTEFISSPALRAISTARLFKDRIEGALKDIRIETNLYLGNEDDYLEIMQSTAPEAQSVAVFGHNPIIEYFAYRSIKGFSDSIPTCAILVYEADINDWEDLDWNKLKLIRILNPKSI
jgi:phosphohistidine phosphatase